MPKSLKIAKNSQNLTDFAFRPFSNIYLVQPVQKRRRITPLDGQPGPGFEKYSPNDNNEYIVKMDSWGNIKQRPRKIHVEFKNGINSTYEHTLQLGDGFMSCIHIVHSCFNQS